MARSAKRFSRVPSDFGSASSQTSAPVARRRAAAAGEPPPETTSTCSAWASMAASSGSRSWESSTTRKGCRAVGTARTSSRGLSASTVPMPVSTALALRRHACPSARAASPVIHFDRPSLSPRRPSADAATLTRTQGLPRSKREKKPTLTSRASSAISSSSGSKFTKTLAARSRVKPAPATNGLGSAAATTQRRNPAAASASQQGGVRP